MTSLSLYSIMPILNQSEVRMANKKIDPSEEVIKHLTIRIPKSLWLFFDNYCKKDNTSMNAKVLSMVKDLKKIK